ncbi:hypothetical protein NQ318_016211 [Aromia moschata]|uniref:Uncharacterized protein n=1 Tax=Aromia moschata TaxID=1265417 RepID=A0AAV8YEY6_9CUCU|nr:hypothetical protein NQ318_016211 [Aromia moschata]
MAATANQHRLVPIGKPFIINQTIAILLSGWQHNSKERTKNNLQLRIWQMTLIHSTSTWTLIGMQKAGFM